MWELNPSTDVTDLRASHYTTHSLYSPPEVLYSHTIFSGVMTINLNNECKLIKT